MKFSVCMRRRTGSVQRSSSFEADQRDEGHDLPYSAGAKIRVRPMSLENGTDKLIDKMGLIR